MILFALTPASKILCVESAYRSVMGANHQAVLSQTLLYDCDTVAAYTNNSKTFRQARWKSAGIGFEPGLRLITSTFPA